MLLEIFTQRNLVADFIRLKLTFIFLNEKIAFAVGKLVADFLFVTIELVRYLLRLRLYKRKSVEVGVFRRGWVTSGVY